MASNGILDFGVKRAGYYAICGNCIVWLCENAALLIFPAGNTPGGRGEIQTLSEPRNPRPLYHEGAPL